MRRKRNVNGNGLYDADTEPFLASTTVPISIEHLPHESWLRHFFRGIGMGINAIVRKINQLLTLALVILLLLLLTRFLLIFFVLKSSQFVYWVFTLSAPFIGPFYNMVPALPYQGFRIDISTLVAILTYTVGVIIIRQSLKVLFSKPV